MYSKKSVIELIKSNSTLNVSYSYNKLIYSIYFDVFYILYHSLSEN